MTILFLIINTLFIAFLLYYLFIYNKNKDSNLIQRFANSYHEKKTASPYYLSISNKNEFDSDVVLFGHNKRLLSDNFGSDKGVEFNTFNGSNYLQLLNQSSSEPFSCDYFRVHSEKLDLSTEFTLESSNANGQSATIVIKLKEYFSATQFQSNIVDVNFPLIIDGNTELRFRLNKKSDISFIFFPSERISLSRLLRGKFIGISYAKNVGIKNPINLFSIKKQSFKDKIKNRLNIFFNKIKSLFKSKTLK